VSNLILNHGESIFYILPIINMYHQGVDKMTDVIRSRSGRKESYDEDKIRNALENAIMNAGFNVEDKQQFIDKTVSNVSRNVQIMSEVESEQIRNIVERNIEQDKQMSGDSSISEAWNNYLK